MTEPRTVTDGDSVVWSCVEGHTGVVCTPNGGAQSVRIELPPSWAQDLSDSDLLEAIERARAAQ